MQIWPFFIFFLLRTTELASAGRVSDDESDDDDDVSDVEDRQGTYEEDFQIDPKDETAFNAYMNTDSAPRKTLADLVIILKLFLSFLSFSSVAKAFWMRPIEEV